MTMRSASHMVDLTLGKLLQATLEQTLKGCSASTPWVISRVDNLDDVRHEQCIVLTISSFKFRIICLLHVSMDQSTRQFVSETTAARAESLDESVFKDYLLELSNSFCGTLKRHLQSSCPPLGMSTPNFIERSSLAHYESIKPLHSAHAKAQMSSNDPALFAASVMVSVAQAGDFQLEHYHEPVHSDVDEADGSGELELF
jgi:hypothetical protein